MVVFFFQAEDGIRDLVRSRGLGDVYKRQLGPQSPGAVYILTPPASHCALALEALDMGCHVFVEKPMACLLYTSDAADERSSVDLGGRRIIKKKKRE